MRPDILQSMASLITDSSFLDRVLSDAARFAASWGHPDLSDFHCFPVLLSGFPDDPITKAALGGRPIADFLGVLEDRIMRHSPINEVSNTTCLLQWLIYRMCADENDVLHLGSLGLAHFYLAYLSRAGNSVYGIYERLGIKAKTLIPNIVHEAGIHYPDIVVLYYHDMHDTWLKMWDRRFPRP